VPFDRNNALNYANKYWNRACDDDRIAIESGAVSVNDKRKAMDAPRDKGWEVYFVSDGGRGENAVFARMVGGKLAETKPDPVLTDQTNHLDDCTHYVSRCLINEGINVKETNRANELIEALIKNPNAKVLALKTDQTEGQKIIDSGVFKVGDVVGYYAEGKGRYHHSAMYIGDANSTGGKITGGITCHSVCRFGGRTQAWNGANDDGWFINDGSGSYTLIHFTNDDPQLLDGNLFGWWQLGKNYYRIAADGTAKSTKVAPRNEEERVRHGDATAQLLQGSGEVIFIWQKPHGLIEVEKWSIGMRTRDVATVRTAAGPDTATRLF
jgi:hypothetical protein